MGKTLEWKSQLREWLKEIFPWNKFEEYVQFHSQPLPGLDVNRIRMMKDSDWAKAESREDVIKFIIFTKDYSYWIRANERYLGCGVQTRKPRAGEDWHRGNDLPDGKFCRKTWENIKDAIIAYELVKVVQIKEPTNESIEGPLIH